MHHKRLYSKTVMGTADNHFFLHDQTISQVGRFRKNISGQIKAVDGKGVLSTNFE
jgi:hypothetical protein